MRRKINLLLSVLAVLVMIACKNDGVVSGNSTKVFRVDTLIHIKKYGRAWVYYAEVDKAGDYFRRMFIDSASAIYVKKTGDLPEGVLFLLETWNGSTQSGIFIRQRIQGEWLANSFSLSSPDYHVSVNFTCNSCHEIAKMTSNVFTLPLLKKTLDSKRVQFIKCDLTDFNPCALDVYQGN